MVVNINLALLYTHSSIYLGERAPHWSKNFLSLSVKHFLHMGSLVSSGVSVIFAECLRVSDCNDCTCSSESDDCIDCTDSDDHTDSTDAISSGDCDNLGDSLDSSDFGDSVDCSDFWSIFSITLSESENRVSELSLFPGSTLVCCDLPSSVGSSAIEDTFSEEMDKDEEIAFLLFTLDLASEERSVVAGWPCSCLLECPITSWFLSGICRSNRTRCNGIALENKW